MSGPVEVQHEPVAEDSTLQIVTGFLHQQRQREWDIAGASPHADSVLVNAQIGGVLPNMLKQGVNVWRGFSIRVGDCDQPGRSRQFSPRDICSHLFELAADHLLKS